MIRFLFILSILNFSGLILLSCSNKHNSPNLNSWIGNYGYEEDPIKAIAGYNMMMVWEFDIVKNEKTYKGILEVNGQQTFTKLATNISGDSSKIFIMYDSLIDGSKELLKTGDTLFSLSKKQGKLITNWYSLEPRLPEFPPKECACFQFER